MASQPTLRRERSCTSGAGPSISPVQADGALQPTEFGLLNAGIVNALRYRHLRTGATRQAGVLETKHVESDSERSAPVNLETSNSRSIAWKRGSLRRGSISGSVFTCCRGGHQRAQLSRATRAP